MSILTFIVYCITFLKLLHQHQAILCTALKTCFDCVAESTCKWSSECIDSTEEYNNSNWYIKYQQCDGDLKSIEDMAFYCYGYNNNTVPMIGGLLTYHGIYSKKHLSCKYVINNPKEKKIIFRNIKQTNPTTMNDLFAITYTFSNDSEATYHVSEEDYTFEGKLKKIVFMYYGPNAPYYSNPFKFDVNYPRGFDVIEIISISIGVLIGSVFVGVLFLALFLYIKKLITDRFYPNAELEEQEIDPITSQRIHEAKQKKYRHLVNQFLKEEPYEISKKCFVSECTICFESFIEGCLLIILNCKHAFHKKCIKQFIYATDLGSVKCPNCQEYLLDYDTVKKMQLQINQMTIVEGERLGVVMENDINNSDINDYNNYNNNENDDDNRSNSQRNGGIEEFQRIEIRRYRINFPSAATRPVSITESNHNSQLSYLHLMEIPSIPQISEPHNH